MNLAADLRPMPSSDGAFARAVRRVAQRATSPDDLEARLRRMYPQTVVRKRVLAGEPLILYIYRDGRYEPAGGTPWWTAPDLASASIDLATGTLTHASDEWLELLGDEPAPGDEVTGRPYTDFLAPEAAEAALATIDALRESGELTSLVLLRRVDGTVAPVAFHAVLDGDRIEIVYRPLETHSG